MHTCDPSEHHWSASFVVYEMIDQYASIIVWCCIPFADVEKKKKHQRLSVQHVCMYANIVMQLLKLFILLILYYKNAVTHMKLLLAMPHSMYIHICNRKREKPKLKLKNHADVFVISPVGLLAGYCIVHTSNDLLPTFMACCNVTHDNESLDISTGKILNISSSRNFSEWQLEFWQKAL